MIKKGFLLVCLGLLSIYIFFYNGVKAIWNRIDTAHYKRLNEEMTSRERYTNNERK